MAALTPEQIAQVARNAGFTGEALKTAIAIALAESGGDPLARGQNNDARRTVDRGLWQINSYWHREVTDACAFDPACAAVEVFRISAGGTAWGAWTTYKRGTYRAMWDRAEQGAAAVSGPSVGGVGGGVGGGAKFAQGWGPLPIPDPADDLLPVDPGDILGGITGGASDLFGPIVEAFKVIGALAASALDSDLYLRAFKIGAGVLIVGAGLWVVFHDPAEKGIAVGRKVFAGTVGAMTGGPGGAATGVALG